LKAYEKTSRNIIFSSFTPSNYPFFITLKVNKKNLESTKENLNNILSDFGSSKGFDVCVLASSLEFQLFWVSLVGEEGRS
jgi:hypothetical protein